MTKQETMIQAARAALNTPFHNQGRASLIGLDCIGLIIHALKAAGCDVTDNLSYGRQPAPDALRDALLNHNFTEASDIESGDVLLLRFNNQPQHVALATSPTSMIHSYAPIGRVVETPLGETWLRRVCGIFRLQD